MLGKVAGLRCRPLVPQENLQALLVDPDYLCFDRTTYDNINGPGDQHNWFGRTTCVPGPNILLQNALLNILVPSGHPTGIQKDKTVLSQFKRRIARFVYNDYSPYASVNVMLTHLQWPTLKHCRNQLKALTMFKIVYNSLTYHQTLR